MHRYLGLKYMLLCNLKKILNNYDTINMNVDGLPLYKSSSTSVWLNLFIIQYYLLITFVDEFMLGISEKSISIKGYNLFIYYII